MNVLLDEWLVISFNKYHVIQGDFEHSIKCLGAGAKSDQVMQFTQENNYLLVTRDNGLVVRRITNGASVAYYTNDKAYVLEVS